MNTPHLGLLKAYENEEVFYKKAYGGPRLSDEIFTKVARATPPPLPKLRPAAGMAATMKSPVAPAAPAKPSPAFASSAPQMGAPAKQQVASPLAAPRAGGMTTGGQAPNVNDFTAQPKQPGTLGRLMGQKAPANNAPTINPMGGKDAPAAASKPVTGAPAAAAAPAGKGLPWNRMLLTGGLLGAGALGLGAMKAGLNFLGGGHGGHAGYGSAPGGYMPPMGVNAYGQPQMGTPIM